MKILIAKTAGFCMGVRRAVEMVLEAPGKHEKPIYTYGPLIHNPQVLNLLKEKGISVINDIPASGTGTVLIRAHGIPPHEKKELEKTGLKVIDATCPRVIKVQTIIEKHAGQGYEVIIIGDEDHPEVKGLLGYAGDKGHVAGSHKRLASLPAFDKAIIVAQTTQNKRFFDEVQKWTEKRFPHYKIFDTICDSTDKRQAEIKHLAEIVDTLIVVGGKNSANTQRLAEIARESGKPVHLVETETELNVKALTSVRSIGITAGASTPNWVIKKIYRTLEMLPSNQNKYLRGLIFIIWRTLLLTNIYVSIGAGCLCHACCKLLGISNHFSYVLISVLYVQSMHILNHLTGLEADRYNDPDRAIFYTKHKMFLAVFALLAGAAGLLKAFTMGVFPFLILLIMSLMGLSYNLRFLPGINYHRIRDIPGSKTILIAAAWGIVTAVFPPLSAWGTINPTVFLVFIWSVSMVFVRTAFFDILDMQGDRIVGKDTIPTLLGEKRSMILLKIMLCSAFLILILAGAFGLTSINAIFLAICPVSMFLVLLAYEHSRILPGIQLEFLIETHFIMTGILSFF